VEEASFYVSSKDRITNAQQIKRLWFATIHLHLMEKNIFE
jgi:hypothetical protein